MLRSGGWRRLADIPASTSALAADFLSFDFKLHLALLATLQHPPTTLTFTSTSHFTHPSKFACHHLALQSLFASPTVGIALSQR